jgi:RimJ/RimL family protein N-acetyltransferase
MRGLLLGDDARVAAWAFRTYQFRPTPYNGAVGVVDETGRLIGAGLYQNFNGANVEGSYYGRGTLTPGIVRGLIKGALAFDPSRLTVVTAKKNRRLIRALQRIGFRLEGAQRRYYGQRDCARNTGVRLVMFREDMDRIAGVEIKAAVAC